MPACLANGGRLEAVRDAVMHRNTTPLFQDVGGNGGMCERSSKSCLFSEEKGGDG